MADFLELAFLRQRGLVSGCEWRRGLDLGFVRQSPSRIGCAWHSRPDSLYLKPLCMLGPVFAGRVRFLVFLVSSASFCRSPLGERTLPPSAQREERAGDASKFQNSSYTSHFRTKACRQRSARLYRVLESTIISIAYTLFASLGLR